MTRFGDVAMKAFTAFDRSDSVERSTQMISDFKSGQDPRSVHQLQGIASATLKALIMNSRHGKPNPWMARFRWLFLDYGPLSLPSNRA
jgi:hypothetical protein